MNTKYTSKSAIPHVLPHETNYSFSTKTLIYSQLELRFDWHPHVEIWHILKGQGTAIIEGKRYTLRAGSICIINPNEIHAAFADIGTPITMHVLRFSYDYFTDKTTQSILEDFIREEKFLPTSILRTFPMYKTILELMDQLFELRTDTNQLTSLYVTSIMYQLLSNIFQNKFFYSKPSTTKKSIPLVKQTIDYINQHFKDTISLDYLSSLLQTSKPHLCRVFKKVTTNTITQYQNTCRIQYACDQLIYTDKTASTISFESGYQQLTYFNKRFKQETSLTPIEYRQALKKG
jgi:AraC-like DNA-binding protein